MAPAEVDAAALRLAVPEPRPAHAREPAGARVVGAHCDVGPVHRGALRGSQDMDDMSKTYRLYGLYGLCGLYKYMYTRGVPITLGLHLNHPILAYFQIRHNLVTWFIGDYFWNFTRV